MSVLLDGKAFSGVVKDKLKQKCEIIKKTYGISPKLAIILVGDNPASEIYVSSKVKSCEYVGITSIVERFSENASQKDIVSVIKRLASDKTVNGIMVQLPLPHGFDEKTILSNIPFEKDVDGLTPLSAGKNLLGEECLLPCTPKGIIELLKHYKIHFSSLNAVIVGRSNLVGKPLAAMLLKENCTVTVCHSKTRDLREQTLKADLLIVATGMPHLINSDMVKDGAVVVDVGINRTPDGLKGDVDFESVKGKVSFITPVPGGVGPMTVAMLLDNAFTAFIKQNNLII